MTVGQAEFTQALLDPEMATPKGLVDPEGRVAGKRFDVYRNNVVSSLLDAMETAFPVVHKLVGENFFRAMAGVYVRQFPPQSPLLMFYGKDFPAFLEGFEPVAHLPYLADVARLELARRDAYHAGDAVPIAGDALAQIAPDDLTDTAFNFVPAARLIRSDHPIFSIWVFNMVDPEHKVTPGAEYILLSRPEWDVQMTPLTAAQYDFLDALQAQQTLGAALETASTTEPEFDLAETLSLCLGTQIMAKTYLKKT